MFSGHLHTVSESFKVCHSCYSKIIRRRQFHWLMNARLCSSSYATSTFPIMHLICPPPPPIFHNLCFSFLLGITAVPREIENNASAKFWVANKVHYGKCGSGVLGRRVKLTIAASIFCFPFCLVKSHLYSKEIKLLQGTKRYRESIKLLHTAIRV